MLYKDTLSESDIRGKYITPDIRDAGWSEGNITREYEYTRGQIHVIGKTAKRDPNDGTRKKADYLLNYPNQNPLAVVEAKVHTKSVGAGIQQGTEYAEDLHAPFVFSSNGDGFYFRDLIEPEEKYLSRDEFPSPEALFRRYVREARPSESEVRTIQTRYYERQDSKTPRYYQVNAINRAVQAVAKGQEHIMFVMATGTGKTYTAFQIIWRLLQGKMVNKVLYLVDRNILADQPMADDFQHFGNEAIKLTRKEWKNPANLSAYKVYVGLYQQLFSDKGRDEKLYENFDPNFFDLIIIDEAHRGSADAHSSWRKILDYFAPAGSGTKVIGMTATPKENNEEYFGEPVYQYTLKQGIQDGFLAPYKVVRVGLDKDLLGYRPVQGQKDDQGELIEDREYNQKDFDRSIVLGKRTRAVAKFVSDYMRKNHDRLDKTIVFGEDSEHAQRLRDAFAQMNPDMMKKSPNYVMRITGDDEEGKNQLGNFEDNESKFPTIVTTAQLLRTGVNVKNVKNIVLDTNINSMTEFKQIIGRGTRLNPNYDKNYFTIFDFRNDTRLFADPGFNGRPIDTINTTTTDVPSDPAKSGDPEKSGGGSNKPPQEHVGKYIVNEEEVKVVESQVYHLDSNGNNRPENIIDYAKRNVLGEYPELHDFLNAWQNSDRKSAILEQLQKHGLLFQEIRKQGDFSHLDDFDLIIHLAYDQPALTKKERADHVKKQGAVFKYQGAARQVIQELLDKYQDESVDFKDLEDPRLLDMDEFRRFGGKIKIVRDFGGIQQYRKAIHRLTDDLSTVGP